ncbi:MAG: tetratricopeptide repeat protein, partial [Fusobacterium sp.]
VTDTKAGDRRPAEIAALENAIAAETVREKVPPMMRYYENAFKKHLENISGNSEKIYLLGNQYFINKKYERAKDIFSKNIDSEENLFGAALTNRFLGYDNTAIDYYSEVIDMNSGIAEAYLGRGICYRNTGRYREALADFLKYKSMRNTEEAYTALGNIYILREEYAKAKQILTEGRVLYPNSELISELLVKAYGN